MKKCYYYHFSVTLAKNALFEKDRFQFAELGLLPYKIGYFVRKQAKNDKMKSGFLNLQKSGWN